MPAKLSNPPTWPDSVLVFSDTDSHIKEQIDAATLDLQDKTGHFSDKRVALLFKPGTYDVDFIVGYYVQVLGLGETPSDTKFIGEKGAYSPAFDPGLSGSLNVFWKSIENIQTRSMLWAVSQAAPLRRIDILENLLLHDKGEFASSEMIANIKINKTVEIGSQQQFCLRNCEFFNYPIGGAWNNVFIGCKGKVPETSGRSIMNPNPDLAVSTIKETPLVAEKPFITIDKNGKFNLQIPRLKKNSIGVEHTIDNCKTIPFEYVYTARAEIDNYQTIQAKIDDGYHILFCPGFYQLTDTLTVKDDYTVLLGIGLATLVSPNSGKPSIKVNNNLIDIRIAGLMFEASEITNYNNSCIIQIGDKNSKNYISEDNISCILADLFIRIGSTNCNVSTETMIKIYSDNVILDGCWLWRSDHTKLSPNEIPRPNEEYHLVTLEECQCDTALEVNGNNLISFGLAAEHCQKDVVVFNGENARVYFYQSEIAYDMTQKLYGAKGYSGYKVNDNIETHLAVGCGVYCFHRDFQVWVESGFKAPINKSGIKFINPFIRYLSGNGGILHILNDIGDPVGINTPKKLTYIN